MYNSAYRILVATCMVILKNEQIFSEQSFVLGTHFTSVSYVFVFSSIPQK